MPSTIPLILASQSPRRRELLEEAGYVFDIMLPSKSAEDGATSGESPAALVSRLAKQKAADVAARVQRGIVIGCDTVAECEGRILGKPTSRGDARKMLTLLRGRVHHVYSGLCLWRRPDDKTQTEIAVTKLKMENISDRAISEYLDTGAWRGKAGGFGYQDRLEWLQVLAGSESNVVGLPMELLAKMVEQWRCTKDGQ